MSIPVIILGAGGHAKVLIEALHASGVQVIGATDADLAKHGTTLLGVSVLGDDAVLSRYRPGDVLLVNGIGSISRPTIRTALFDSFTAKGYSFATVVHPSAVIASDAAIAEGVQVMARAVIQPGCILGRNSIINTGAVVDHDCVIGDHVHLAPGTTLSGSVIVESYVFIGAGATVIHGIRVGRGGIVGAGSIVLKNVAAGACVAGNPARELRP